nr:hypothetical protein [Thiocapsa sp.]
MPLMTRAIAELIGTFWLVLGGCGAAAFLIWFIAADMGMHKEGQATFELAANSLAVNGYGSLSPQGYGMMAGLVTEIVMTAMFLFIILGVTDKRGTAVAGGLRRRRDP